MPNKLQQEQSDCVTAEEGSRGRRPRRAILPFSGLSGIHELLCRSDDFNFRARGKKDELWYRLASHSLFKGEVTEKSDSLEKEVLSVIAAKIFSLIAIPCRVSRHIAYQRYTSASRGVSKKIS